MTSQIYKLSTILIIMILVSCSQKVSQKTILDFDQKEIHSFHYFANGHLTKEKYDFKTANKDGREAGEIIRASDASVWSGIATQLENPISITDGNKFSIDVWMDHYGSFSFKLEDSKDGGADTNLSVKNTKINEWETLIFDYKDAIYNHPSYSKIAIFVDLNDKSNGKDIVSYFTNIRQIINGTKKTIHGNKEDAITIVVLGSSTAAGTGPKETKNAWVNRYRRKVQEDNGHHKVINLAVGGYTTYNLLPTGTKVPNSKEQPNPEHNVTKAFSFTPDAVLINLPSNDANNSYPVSEQMENYRKICKPFYDKGIPVWASTPQGRNFSKEKVKIQIELRDSTYVSFGRKTLPFWKDYNDWSGHLLPKYDSGDGIHMNDDAHLLLFEEVWNKDILGYVLDKRNGITRQDSAFTSPLEYEKHTLIWQDEFNGSELDMNSWTHEEENGCPTLCGWGNNEKVWYRPENTSIKDGKLIITAKPDKEQEGYWSASRIVTRNKVNFQHGRIDVRAKLPETQGLWPAIWLLGQNHHADGWPYCGEIDIMEEVGHIPYRIRGTLFYKSSGGWMKYIGNKTELKYSNYSDNFHVYSIVWNKEGIKYLVDDQMYIDRKYAELDLIPDDNPFLKPFYMILNCAVGGNLPGNPDASSVFPQTFEIDYVRYFKEE